jgi:hypothetical protein
MRRVNIVALVVVFLCAGTIAARAEDRFGIKVYEGAKYDAETSKIVAESMSINAFCYRTNDGVAKVTGFYKTQPGLESMGESQEGAMFKKGNVDITVQNPWMDMRSGKMMKDTLITIVKH